MKKKPNNSLNAAALLLGISVERLETILDSEKELFDCKREKTQIADMYKELYNRFEKMEAELNSLKGGKHKS